MFSTLIPLVLNTMEFYCPQKWNWICPLVHLPNFRFMKKIIHLFTNAPFTVKAYENSFSRLPEGQISTLPHREKTTLVSSPSLKVPVVGCRHLST